MLWASQTGMREGECESSLTSSALARSSRASRLTTVGTHPMGPERPNESIHSKCYDTATGLALIL